MPRGFSENQRQHLQEKLIASAFDALANTGVRRTTVEDLARSAGISTGAFYKFFPSKETLFFVVYDRAEEDLKNEFTAFVEPSIEISAIAVRDALKQMLRSEAMQSLLRLMQKEELDYLLRGVDPKMIAEHLQRDGAFLQNLIEKLSARGLHVTPDVNRILSYLQALFVLCAARSQYEPYASQIIDAFVDTFINEIIA
ncbi:transcriptional regulator, TetR family [Longilinea arvoryzae]|uniref:Transcriptional regulator, TetR family n=1 Tax=Longilinea arvoryzae TaxID=360412 RepID=A0A0S7BH01_9CHLR|nr:TetR/AcrR family transcriptional regulator [Longilinea arvoryzae]GAP13843.1 transcriptional regulator, TetR family [Longilinea arvoryzae]